MQQWKRTQWAISENDAQNVASTLDTHCHRLTFQVTTKLYSVYIHLLCQAKISLYYELVWLEQHVSVL